MHTCAKCGKATGFILLVLGVLFLLRDLNVWNFWNVSGWSALFILGGIITWGSCCCSDCKGMTKHASSSTSVAPTRRRRRR